MKFKNFFRCRNTSNSDNIRLKSSLTAFYCFLGFFTFGISLFIGGEVLQVLGSKYEEQRFVKQGFYMILFGLISVGISIIYLIVAIGKYVQYRNESPVPISRTQSIPFTISLDNNCSSEVFQPIANLNYDPPPPYSRD